MTTTYKYTKKNGEKRDVIVESSKTTEFAITRDDEQIETHINVWDVENEGWRTLIKSNIKSVTHSEPVLNRQHGVDTRPINRQHGVDCRNNELCWHYYKMASDNYRWYYDFRTECVRVFEESNSGYLIDYLDKYWEMNTKVFLYKKKDGSIRNIIARDDYTEFRAKIADKKPELFANGMSHKRVWDVMNDGWRTLNNNNIISCF